MRRYRQPILTPGLQNALTLQPILSPHLQNVSLKEWFMIFIDRHKHRFFVIPERLTKYVAVFNAFCYLNKYILLTGYKKLWG